MRPVCQLFNQPNCSRCSADLRRAVLRAGERSESGPSSRAAQLTGLCLTPVIKWAEALWLERPVSKVQLKEPPYQLGYRPSECDRYTPGGYPDDLRKPNWCREIDGECR